MKVKDHEFVLYLHTWRCFLWAWYFHRYFSYSIFQKTRLIAIDNLRTNLFNAISKWFSCDSKVTVEESNGFPVFQKIGRFICLGNKSNQSSFLRDWKISIYIVTVEGISWKGLYLVAKTLWNSAGSPSVPGILLETFVFKLPKNSASVNRPSYSFFVNKIHLPLSYQAAMKSVLISRRVTFEDNTL